MRWRPLILGYGAILALVILGTVLLKIRPKRLSDKLRVRAVRYTSDGTKTFETLILAKNETLFYTDAWRSHWCPYYDDRAFFLTPRINDMLHLARSRGFRALHLNWKGHENKLDKRLRKIGRDYSARGETRAIQETWINNAEDKQNYTPGFKDSCIFDGYSRFGKTRSQRPNPTISVSQNDLIAINFKSVASIANYLNIKTLVLMGMHTNMCIRSAVLYLSLVNISVVYVRDLLDACYWYRGQKRYGVDTHSKMNNVTYVYGVTKHGIGIETQDLLTSLLEMPPAEYEPAWILYQEAAVPFRHYYLSDER